MKIKLPTILDTIFTAFIAFILCFIFFYYFLSRELAITFALTLSALISLFAFKILSKRKKKFYLTKAEADEKNIMVSQLNLSTLKEQTDLIEKALIKTNLSPVRKRGYLYLPDKNSAIFCKFSFDGVTKTDIVKIFNTINRSDTAYVLSEKFSAEIEEFAQRFDGRIKTVSAQEVYRFLSDNDTLPPQKFAFYKPTRLSLSAFSNLIKKKNAKRHLMFGLTFLFLSYFATIKTYYVIVSSIFLITALLCRLFGSVDKTT